MSPGDDGAECAFCYRCGYAWMPRGEMPKRCSRCRSARWNVPEKKERECRFCGTVWKMEAIDEQCPGCGRRQTERASERQLHCNQCDHDWMRKGEAPPKKCPLCRSAEWNEPKAERAMCNQCGHIWRLRASGRPARCPGCQSDVWDRPLKVVKCQRCGHIWKMRAPRKEGNASVCPACKSPRWNESPVLCVCDKCSKAFFVKSDRTKRCPACHGSMDRHLSVCAACGRRWYRTGNGPSECPGCGAVPPAERENTTSVVLWAENGSELVYVSENGYGCIYLWRDGIPVCARYIYEVLKDMGVTIGRMADSVNDGSMDAEWREYARGMNEARDGYAKYVDYFRKRLMLSEIDAKVLAIHFTGMSPSAIAVRLGLPDAEVGRIFDRIMAAYSESGIVVDDTVFTDDPFRYY